MVDLVLWFFILALLPMAAGLAWKLLSGAGDLLRPAAAARRHGG